MLRFNSALTRYFKDANYHIMAIFAGFRGGQAEPREVSSLFFFVFE